MSDGALEFSQRAARSSQIVYAVTGLMLAESVAVHALLSSKPWYVHAVLLLVNVSTIWLLIRSDRDVARRGHRVDAEGVHVTHGMVASGLVPWSQVQSVIRPTWQSTPSDLSAGYLKLTGMHDPNVIMQCREGTRVRVLGGFRMRVRVIGLRLDDPDAFTAVATRYLGQTGGS